MFIVGKIGGEQGVFLALQKCPLAPPRRNAILEGCSREAFGDRELNSLYDNLDENVKVIVESVTLPDCNRFFLSHDMLTPFFLNWSCIFQIIRKWETYFLNNTPLQIESLNNEYRTLTSVDDHDEDDADNVDDVVDCSWITSGTPSEHFWRF